jgi:hypothetical protein
MASLPSPHSAVPQSPFSSSLTSRMSPLGLPASDATFSHPDRRYPEAHDPRMSGGAPEDFVDGQWVLVFFRFRGGTPRERDHRCVPVLWVLQIFIPTDTHTSQTPGGQIYLGAGGRSREQPQVSNHKRTRGVISSWEMLAPRIQPGTRGHGTEIGEILPEAERSGETGSAKRPWQANEAGRLN